MLNKPMHTRSPDPDLSLKMSHAQSQVSHTRPHVLENEALHAFLLFSPTKTSNFHTLIFHD